MKVKVESVTVGKYEQDSITVTINGNKTEVLFDKASDVSKYNGKYVELVNSDGIYKIKEVNASK